MFSRKKKQSIEERITDLLVKVFSIYNEIDNSLVINGVAVNMKKELVRRISLDNDVDFYFGFFSAVDKYRTVLKESVIPKIGDIIANEERLYIENRIKNVNSLSSKLYQYIQVKDEKGDVPINKCVNDIYGLRVEIPIRSISKIKKMIERIKARENLICKIIDSSKNGYRAVHLYLFKDNRSLRWEIQFWPLKFDAKNRDSHARHKQFYTKWESSFDYNNLFEEVVE